MTAAAKRAIVALRRRLEKWELEHLRQLACDLSERLERAEAEAARAKDACFNAENVAEFWRENAMELQSALCKDGLAVGITREGQMGVVNDAVSTSQADHV